MKKNILIFIVLIVAGLFTYNYLNTGKITLIPSFSLSEEERKLKMLEKELQEAERAFAQAGRSAGLSGLDTTADAEAARHVVKRVENSARELKRKITSEDVRFKIEELEKKINELKNEMGI